MVEEGEDGGFDSFTYTSGTEFVPNPAYTVSNNEPEEVEVPLVWRLQQVINKQGNFNEEGCAAALSAGQFDVEDHVTICCTYGGTNAGKSTLLGQLEGTHFETHNDEEWVPKKTNGLWVGASPQTQGVVTLDFEGSNSSAQERTFAGDAKLMWLAFLVCPVLLWCIADMSAAAVDSALFDNLKLLFQVYLSMDEDWEPGKRAIVFVVRGKIKTNQKKFDSMKAHLKRRMQECWADAGRKTRQTFARLEDVIKVDVIGLQHEDVFDRDNLSEAYKSDITYLKSKLAKIHEDSAIRRSYTIPPGPKFAVEFTQHLSRAWSAVKANSLINIPDHLDLFAAEFGRRVFCNVKDIFAESLRELKGSGSTVFDPMDFRSQMEVLLLKCENRLKFSKLKKFPAQLEAFLPELKQHMLQEAERWRNELVQPVIQEIVTFWRNDFGRRQQTITFNRETIDGHQAVYQVFESAKTAAMEHARTKLECLFLEGLDKVHKRDLDFIAASLHSHFENDRVLKVKEFKCEAQATLTHRCDQAFNSEAPPKLLTNPPRNVHIPKRKMWHNLRSKFEEAVSTTVQEQDGHLGIWGESFDSRKLAARELEGHGEKRLHKRWKEDLVDQLEDIVKAICDVEGEKVADWQSDPHLETGICRTKVYRIFGQCEAFQLRLSPEQIDLLERPWLDRACQESDHLLYLGPFRFTPFWVSKPNESDSAPKPSWRKGASASSPPNTAHDESIPIREEDVGIREENRKKYWSASRKMVFELSEQRKLKLCAAWERAEWWKHLISVPMRCRDIVAGYKRDRRMAEAD